MARRTEPTRWVSHLRVRTVEQAEKELSLTAQRHAVVDFATRHRALIDHEYVEAGASGTDSQRPVLNELLGDAHRGFSHYRDVLLRRRVSNPRPGG